LIREASKHGSFLVASLFVNPTQFGANEDFDRYPIDLNRDCRLAEAAGADLAWMPTMKDIYPSAREGKKPELSEQAFTVRVQQKADRLCGLSRPDFFHGICTVVLKLFQLVRPDFACFGEKDFQQLALIQSMVEDFFLDIEIISCPIVRESDGLAMSSRNVRLSPHGRQQAVALYQLLVQAHEAFVAGERDALALANRLKQQVPDAFLLDYCEFRDPRTLELVHTLQSDSRLFLAASLEGVRLIDNAAVGHPTFHPFSAQEPHSKD
jgi:pantoate--beta-alanine ligase